MKQLSHRSHRSLNQVGFFVVGQCSELTKTNLNMSPHAKLTVVQIRMGMAREISLSNGKCGRTLTFAKYTFGIMVISGIQIILI